MRKRTTTLGLLTGMAVLALADAASAYYSPGLGRFLSRDPFGEAGPNAPMRSTSSTFLPLDPVAAPYSFVDNNPIDDVDVLGLDKYHMRIGRFRSLAGHSFVYLQSGDIYLVTAKGAPRPSTARWNKPLAVSLESGGCGDLWQLDPTKAATEGRFPSAVGVYEYSEGPNVRYQQDKYYVSAKDTFWRYDLLPYGTSPFKVT